MQGRAKDFFSKFLFCLRNSKTVTTLFTLIINSKRFSNFYASGKLIGQDNAESPVRYLLKLNGQIRNIFLRTFSGDIGIFYEVFWRKIYYVPLLQWQGFKCVVDLGANVGMASLFFKALSPNANVIAIEPDPENFSILKVNTEREICSGCLTAIQAAVADIDGILSYQKSRLAYSTKIIDDIKGPVVRCISLNTLIREHSLEKIDLVKIDIEGFEHRLFERNTEWLNLVQNIIIEIHSKENFEAFSNKVVHSGFTIRKLSKDVAPEGIYWASRDFGFSKLAGHGK
jgi:FkbM family methyltransferase